MLAAADSAITPKRGREAQARVLWKKRGALLLPTRMYTPLVRVMAVRLPQASLGSAWVPCHPHIDGVNDVALEKALCVYLNSSVSVWAMMRARSPKKLTYPQFSMADLRARGEAVERLASAYDAHRDKPFMPLAQMCVDHVRLAMDAVLIDALGVGVDEIASIRQALAAEPLITGRRYAA